MTSPPINVPPDQTRRDYLRVIALAYARDAMGSGAHLPEQYTRLADPFYAWLIATETAQILWVARVTDPDGNVVHTYRGVSNMTTPTPTTVTVEMSANDTLDITAKTADSEGNPTPDQLAWVDDDPQNVTAEITPSADTKSLHLRPVGPAGTVNVTLTDPSAPNVTGDIFQVVIDAGATVTLSATTQVNPGANTGPGA
jgi:hypothetical protein